MKRKISVSIVMIMALSICLYAQMQNTVPVQTREKKILQDSCSHIAGENSLENLNENGIRNMRNDGAGNAGSEDGVNEPGDEKGVRISAWERAGKGSSCPLDEKFRTVLFAYAEYLQKYYEEYPYETDWIRFDLVYVDADDIPELAVIPSGAHASSVLIYVYSNGNVVEAGGYGSFGKCRFNPHENLILSTYLGQGEEESSFFRLEGTESIELQAFHMWPEYNGFQYVGDCYEVDGAAVSEDEYNEAWEKWEVEELSVWGYEDAVARKGFDGTDDLYGELCRRFFFARGHNHAGKVFAAGSMHSVRGQVGTDGSITEISFNGRKPAKRDDSCLEEWKQVYLAYMEADEEYAAYCRYSMIYVDDDHIPELMIDTQSGAGGYYILTFHDHVLDVWHSDPNITYIERGNLICNSGGKMGRYYDNVYTIRDGKWSYVDGGTHGDGPDGMQIDENGNYMEFFYWVGPDGLQIDENGDGTYWDGEELTQTEYEIRLNEIFPAEQSTYPQKYYTLDEIRSLLRTGDVVSAKPRYELSECRQPFSVEKGLRKLEIFLEGNFLDDIIFQASERAICYYGSHSGTPGLFEEYFIRVYKETADLHICLEETLLVSGIVGDIYVLKEDDYVLVASGALEGFAMSGEPESFWMYEEGSMEPEKHPDEVQDMLTEVFRFLKEQEGMSNFKIMYEGIYSALGRRYHRVTLIEDNGIQIHRLQKYCIDMDNGNLYEVREDSILAVVTELHYMGKVSVE